MRFFVLVFGFMSLLSSCGNNDAYKAEVEKLRSELKLMQEQMTALQLNTADVAKTELDATGIAIVDLEKLLDEYKGYQASLRQVESVINRYGKELEKMQSDYNQMYQVIVKDKQTFGDEYDETEDVAALQKLERDALLKEQEYTKKSKELNDEVMSKELQKINAHSKSLEKLEL